MSYIEEAMPASCKPRAGVGMRTFTEKGHEFGALAPKSSRASPLHLAGAEDSTKSLSPKHVRLIGSSTNVVSTNFSSVAVSS